MRSIFEHTSTLGRATVGVLALGACGGPASPAVVVAVPPPVARATGPAPSGSARGPDVDDWPHANVMPGERACGFPRSGFTGALRTAPDLAPFAHVDGTSETEVVVPADPQGAPAVVEARSAGLSLRGVVPLAALEVHASRPLRLGDLSWPKPNARLRIIGARRGGLDVELTAPVAGIVDLAAPLAASVPCSHVGWTIADFEPRDQLGPASGRSLLVGGPIPIAAHPGGAPAATLLLANDEPVVEVVDRSGVHSRVVWDRGESLLVGWVHQRFLAPPPKPVALGVGGGGTGWGVIGTGARGTRPRRSCESALALGVLQGETTSRVGTLPPGVIFEVLETVGEHTIVGFQVEGVHLAEARWIARTKEIQGCETVVEERR